MVDVAEYDDKPSLDEVFEVGGSGNLRPETLRILKVGGYRIPPMEPVEELEQQNEADEAYSDETEYTPLDDSLCILTNNTVGAFNFNIKQWSILPQGVF